MGKTSERCPGCGAHVPVCRTFVVPARFGETCKDREIDCVRYQRLVCPVCGMSGDRSVFVGRTHWDEDGGRSALSCRKIVE